MIGVRVGVEVQAPEAAVTAAMATLPWMAPERIALDDERSLLLLETAFEDGREACAYAERRVRKSAEGLAVPLRILSSEAFPPVIDLRVGGHDSARAVGNDSTGADPRA